MDTFAICPTHKSIHDRWQKYPWMPSNLNKTINEESKLETYIFHFELVNGISSDNFLTDHFSLPSALKSMSQNPSNSFEYICPSRSQFSTRYEYFLTYIVCDTENLNIYSVGVKPSYRANIPTTNYPSKICSLEKHHSDHQLDKKKYTLHVPMKKKI